MSVIPLVPDDLNNSKAHSCGFNNEEYQDFLVINLISCIVDHFYCVTLQFCYFWVFLSSISSALESPTVILDIVPSKNGACEFLNLVV